MTTVTSGATLRRNLDGLWTAVGCLVLGAAIQAVVVLPPSWLTVGLALVATVALAQDRRLGWIPAGLLVAVTLPFARGGDVAPLLVFGFPLRPQDAAVVLAFGGGLWQLARRGPHRVPLGRPAVTILVASGAFLAMGVVALGIGLVRGHEPVDILRDVRWWSLYLIAPLAIVSGVRRASVLRAMLIGITLFAVLILVTALLPRFEGALKDHVYTYDGGLLRLQFGNSMLLVPAVAYALWRALQRFSPLAIGWLVLLFGAQLLSLTRMSIFVTGLVVIGVLAAHVWQQPQGRRHRALRSSLAAVLVLSLSLVAAVGLSELGSRGSGASGRVPVNPLERITFQGEGSDFGAVVGSIASGGRFATYGNAFAVIGESPVAGGGLGQMVEVRFAYNVSRARDVGLQPGVDNAYLTVAIKAGLLGVVTFAALLLLSVRAALGWHMRRHRAWYLPALLGVGILTMTQAFAVSSYGPFALALLAAVPFLGYASSSRSAASDQR